MANNGNTTHELRMVAHSTSGQRESEMKQMKWMGIMITVALAAGCGTTTGTGGGGAAATDTSGGGADTGGQQGDSTKNKADVKVTDDANTTVQVKGEKVASAGDATAKTWGATNADTLLSMFITEAGAESKAIQIWIDTAKHPLPAKGIPVGAADSDAWVSYTVAGAALTGTFTSKDKGTIDVSPCPSEGKALVGTLNGVVLYNETPVGPKTLTLDGTFNLVFFGGAGAVKCTEAPKETDAGSTSGEKSPFAPPAGSTCDADPCDGGKNATRMCCPYGKCMFDCNVGCQSTMTKCMTDCPPNITCPAGCAGKVATCMAACPETCNVSSECKTAATALAKCENEAEPTCAGAGKSGDALQACKTDACCAELKAAF